MLWTYSRYSYLGRQHKLASDGRQDTQSWLGVLSRECAYRGHVVRQESMRADGLYASTAHDRTAHVVNLRLAHLPVSPDRMASS